jgi:hypothetical protein
MTQSSQLTLTVEMIERCIDPVPYAAYDKRFIPHG